MREILEKALRADKADYLDIRLEDKLETNILYRGSKLETIEENQSLGGTVRALIKGGWGVVSFDDLDELPKYVKLAVRGAKLIGSEESKLAEVPVIQDKVKAKVKVNPADIPLEDKQQLASHYNKILLGYPKIKTSSVYYRDEVKNKYFINTEGTFIEQEQIYTGLGMSAIARDGARVERAGEGKGSIEGYQRVENLDYLAGKVAERAESLLDADLAKGGKHTVVINPRLCGVFVHEAFGHLSEADHIYENKSLLDVMELGKPFGVENLNIVDEGLIPGLPGTMVYDDEGVRTTKNYLIKEGKLYGRLHSRETAGKMGERVTGNARAVSYEHKPIVRMTTTYMEAGDWTFEDMIREIDEGYYVLYSQGGETSLDRFTFSAGEAYVIKDGSIREKVRNLTLTGNVFETLKNIDAIGSDLELEGSGAGGGCGRGAQFPLPVSFGGPHIRIRNVIVGGR